MLLFFSDGIFWFAGHQYRTRAGGGHGAEGKLGSPGSPHGLRSDGSCALHEGECSGSCRRGSVVGLGVFVFSAGLKKLVGENTITPDKRCCSTHALLPRREQRMLCISDEGMPGKPRRVPGGKGLYRMERSQDP